MKGILKNKICSILLSVRNLQEENNTMSESTDNKKSAAPVALGGLKAMRGKGEKEFCQNCKCTRYGKCTCMVKKS